MTPTASVILTPEEREAGERVIRRWHRNEILACARLPAREQALLVLAAGLLDLAPGSPLERDPIEVP